MSIWSSLVFNAGDAVSTFASGLNFRIPDRDGKIVYKNNRYKSVLVHIAKRTVMATLEQELNSILPKFYKKAENKQRQLVIKQQEADYKELIKNRESQAESWGKITAEGNHTVIATDRYGDIVKEALILYYDEEESHTVSTTKKTYTNGIAGTPAKESYQTKTVWHIDLSPKVSTSSTKNIVLTQVQGRDYTRKELVSGGDLQFTINGNIVSDEIGVYPSEGVKKFVKIMQYNGILNVNFMVFSQLEVKRIIIKDWSLDQQEYKNVQPYSFSCVAVESDDEIKISSDTITTINSVLQESTLDSWYKMVLKKKLIEIGVNSAASITEQVTGMGLDELTKNI